MLFLPTNPLVDERSTIRIFDELTPYIKHLRKVADDNNYSYPESSINLPLDKNALRNVVSHYENLISRKLKYIIVVGIGGANLGTKAFYDALRERSDLLRPKMIFLDAVSAKHLNALIELLETCKEPEEIILIVVSKSGTTIETLTNAEIVLDSRPDLQKRLVVTTDAKSPLAEKAKKLGAIVLDIPEIVGDRYAVFSTEGLFPLTCAGIDVGKALEGAMAARSIGLKREAEENQVALSAILLYQNYLDGKIINENFFFNAELESLGKWYRQLISESVGKNGKGVTPTVAIGPADMHSVGQLHLGGPNDKFFTFVFAKSDENLSMPKRQRLSPLDILSEKSTSDITAAIYEGVKSTYLNNRRPFVEIRLDEISEYEIGFYMQFKMMETMYLGKLFGVDAFDQPSVESYKEAARKILAG